jgi:methylase of polypeptide subunit release factors
VPLTAASVQLDDDIRTALAHLGDVLLHDAGTADRWCTSMMLGEPVVRSVLEAHVGASVIDELLRSGLARTAGDRVNFAVTFADIGGRLAVIPKAAWGPDVVYLGPDSAHLAEAAMRLVPNGERAAELGTGTGLLTVLLAGRYETVVGADLSHSVVMAAAVTQALNRVPPTCRLGSVVADVGDGLRPGAFDLVVANAPWVPLDDSFGDDRERELFAHGGVTGIELPARFLREGAQLLRAGGVAITLALDVTLASASGEPAEERPLCAVLDELAADGFRIAVLPTPFNREQPRLVEIMSRRQPRIVDATHVAVVVARPRHEGDDRASLLAAAEILGQRWERRPVAAVAS